MVVLRTPVAHARRRTSRRWRSFACRSRRDRAVRADLRRPRTCALPAAIDPRAGARGRPSDSGRDWIEPGATHGDWHDEPVMRSLITLKALTYAPTGGIVAAPTTSLPEQLGGVRNWDYRFCWLRDATLTLLALMNAGYYEEARAWRDWLLRAVAGSAGAVQIMYGIAGERRLTEWERALAAGLRRIAAGAHRQRRARQLQLDVYGEVMDALHQARRGGPRRAARRLGAAARADRASRDGLATAGRRHLGGARAAAALHPFEGDGLGRVRPRDQGGREASASTGRSMRWRERRASDPRRRLRQRLRSASAAASCSPTARKELDASLLLIPLVGFLPPDDPRVRGTVAAIERELMRGRLRAALRHRARRTTACRPAKAPSSPAASGSPTPTCCCGRHRRGAARCSSGCSALRNDVGLLAEEYDPRARRHARQLPAGVLARRAVNTALNLTRARKAGRAARRARRRGLTPPLLLRLQLPRHGLRALQRAQHVAAGELCEVVVGPAAADRARRTGSGYSRRPRARSASRRCRRSRRRCRRGRRRRPCAMCSMWSAPAPSVARGIGSCVLPILRRRSSRARRRGSPLARARYSSIAGSVHVGRSPGDEPGDERHHHHAAVLAAAREHVVGHVARHVAERARAIECEKITGASLTRARRASSPARRARGPPACRAGSSRARLPRRTA